MQIKESLIAVTALANGRVIATHHTQDFVHARFRVVNPFNV